jgi:hypothetical protein
VLRRGCALVVRERRRRRIWRAVCQSAIDFTAAAEHRHAVDDELVPQELGKLTAGISALETAVPVYDERAVAVINIGVDIPATARTTAHEVLVPASTLRRRYCVGACCRPALELWRLNRASSAGWPHVQLPPSS